MAAATDRRVFTVADARVGVFVTNEERLWVVVRVRGVSRAGKAQGHAAVKLMDCAESVPRDTGEEAAGGEWVPISVAMLMRVVEPSGE